MPPPPCFSGAGQSSKTLSGSYNQFISLVKTTLCRDALATPDRERNHRLYQAWPSLCRDAGQRPSQHSPLLCPLIAVALPVWTLAIARL